VTQANQFFGKYRGKVANNNDPLQLGRLQVFVAAFPSHSQNWATPCVPYAGLQTGVYAIPPIGANVWVEFEGGDPNCPIWSGCFWGQGEVPALAIATPAAVPHIYMQTPLLNSLLISDAPGPAGGIRIATKSGAMISINETGIVITNGQGATITMTGKTVDINQGAFTVLF
jgi:uncharacterized protein involved in type VI secretion and phage assembly